MIACLAVACGRRDSPAALDIGVTPNDGPYIYGEAIPIWPDYRPRPLDFGPHPHPDIPYQWPDYGPWYPDYGPWPYPDFIYQWPDMGPYPWPDGGPWPYPDAGGICDPICYFAIQCGTFTPSQMAQCQTWCNGMTLSAQACVQKAAQVGSCIDLKQCSTPPPPPPPPPPQDCANICTYLSSPPCSLLPSNQYWTCYGACMNLTAQKIQCAKNAMAAGQCMQVAMCIM